MLCMLSALVASNMFMAIRTWLNVTLCVRFSDDAQLSRARTNLNT